MNQCVIITGASGGIGRGAALAFAKKGYRLALIGNSHYDELCSFTAELIDKFSIEAAAFKCNVGNAGEVHITMQDIKERFSSIDILVNCAGISKVGLFHEMSTADWGDIISTNLSSVFYFCKEAAPYMISAQRGRIVNVSSVFGIYGASCEAAYSATKGGVNAFTRSLGKELAPSNIQVNAIAFGAIDTVMNDNLDADEKAALSEEIPAGCFASADDAGSFIVTVAESPSYLNGQIIQFDGAWI